jgi:hypothetical protein
MKGVLCVAMITMLLTGCMSLHEVRQTPPTRQAMTAGDYAILANCVAEGLQTARRSGDLLLEPGDLIYQVIHRSEQRRATVTGYAFGGAMQVPFIDLTFTQQQAGVLIETRLLRFQGGDQPALGAKRVGERAWPIVETCAGGSVVDMPTS